MADHSAPPPASGDRPPLHLAHVITGPADADNQHAGSSEEEEQQEQSQQTSSLLQLQHQHHQYCTSHHVKASMFSRLTGKNKSKKQRERAFDLNSALVCAHRIIDEHRAKTKLFGDRILELKRLNTKWQCRVMELESQERIRGQVDQMQALHGRIDELEKKVAGLEGPVDAQGG